MRFSSSVFSRPVWPIFLAAALIATGCSGGGDTQAQTTGNKAGNNGNGGTGIVTVPVSTGVVEQKAVPVAINVIGTAEAYHTVAVRAQITGELTSVTFKEGDDVQMGQVLFTLDKRPLEAALAQAQ